MGGHISNSEVVAECMFPFFMDEEWHYTCTYVPSYSDYMCQTKRWKEPVWAHCLLHICPNLGNISRRDGGWTEWIQTTECSSTCGIDGILELSR